MTCRVFVTALCAGRRAAFSLLELLLTVAIILILTTLYWSPSRGSRQRALQASCGRNLEKLYIALQLYSSDNKGRFPSVLGAKTSAEALDSIVPRYASDTTLFICPGSSDSAPPSGESIRKCRISYAYYMGLCQTNQQVLMSDRQVNTSAKAASQLTFSEDGKPPGNNHRQYGGNFLYCDGHVELAPSKTRVALPVGPGETLLNPEP
jgi:prepilin-type processing-associated H-X9-DG protein/prepilin-type N-terminal cleavage/methylation domain-containing protein